MRHPMLSLLFTMCIIFSDAFADSKRPDHYQGEPANTIAEARENLKAYNAKLARLLEGKPSDDDMQSIHQISYTLENALEKIAIEIKGLQDALEHVHLGSEDLQQQKVKQHGAVYLEKTKELFGQDN